MELGKISELLKSLRSMGADRIAAVAIAIALVTAVLGAATYFTSKAGFETLYIGLTPQDVSRMGLALSEAGILFEASLDGTKIGVPLGQAAEARALLAAKGLPGSPNSGYELFDKMGALGLTSYMQEITRLRALEGELGRTIQHIRGVRAARVHLVLPDTSSLRSKKQMPSASVVVSSDGLLESSVTAAIRHVVAAAIPEMTPGRVSIVGTDGRLLAEGGDADVTTTKLIELERQVADQLIQNVRRTLNPYFGSGNFEVSALARLNIDKRQSTETAYDPEKRVERSVRVVKQAESSQAETGNSPVSVEQNIPNEGSGADSKEHNKRSQDHKEETINYEVSSKSASTVSDGYRVENISVAIILNRKRLTEIIGKEPGDEDIKAQIAQVEKLVGSAVGLDNKRGDSLNVVAVNFTTDPLVQEQSDARGWTPTLLGVAAMLIKGVTILLSVVIVVWMGLKPLTKALTRTGTRDSIEPPAIAGETLDSETIGRLPSGPAVPINMPQMASPLLASDNPFGSAPDMGSGWSSDASAAQGPIERLNGLLTKDEEHAAAVLKHWVRTG